MQKTTKKFKTPPSQNFPKGTVQTSQGTLQTPPLRNLPICTSYDRTAHFILSYLTSLSKSLNGAHSLKIYENYRRAFWINWMAILKYWNRYERDVSYPFEQKVSEFGKENIRGVI